MTLPLSPAAPAPAFDAADYCSTRQAAALLGVSHRTIQLWVESGTLQAWKTAGGHRRIALVSIERHLERRRQAVRGPAVRRRLLLVDDDPAMLALYAAAIAGWNLPLDVICAANGVEALIRIGETRPDLFVGDLNMPGVDAVRMIRFLRASEAYAGLELIVVSGIEPATIRAMGLPDAVQVVPKPVAFDALRAAVDSALARREAAGR